MTVEELKLAVANASAEDVPGLVAEARKFFKGVPTWVYALAGINPDYPVSGLEVVREFIAAEEKADA